MRTAVAIGKNESIIQNAPQGYAVLFFDANKRFEWQVYDLDWFTPYHTDYPILGQPGYSFTILEYLVPAQQYLIYTGKSFGTLNEAGVRNLLNQGFVSSNAYIDKMGRLVPKHSNLGWTTVRESSRSNAQLLLTKPIIPPLPKIPAPEAVMDTKSALYKEFLASVNEERSKTRRAEERAKAAELKVRQLERGKALVAITQEKAQLELRIKQSEKEKGTLHRELKTTQNILAKKRLELTKTYTEVNTVVRGLDLSAIKQVPEAELAAMSKADLLTLCRTMQERDRSYQKALKMALNALAPNELADKTAEKASLEEATRHIELEETVEKQRTEQVELFETCRELKTENARLKAKNKELQEGLSKFNTDTDGRLTLAVALQKALDTLEKSQSNIAGEAISKKVREGTMTEAEAYRSERIRLAKTEAYYALQLEEERLQLAAKFEALFESNRQRESDLKSATQIVTPQQVDVADLLKLSADSERKRNEQEQLQSLKTTLSDLRALRDKLQQSATTELENAALRCLGTLPEEIALPDSQDLYGVVITRSAFIKKNNTVIPKSYIQLYYSFSDAFDAYKTITNLATERGAKIESAFSVDTETTSGNLLYHTKLSNGSSVQIITTRTSLLPKRFKKASTEGTTTKARTKSKGSTDKSKTPREAKDKK